MNAKPFQDLRTVIWRNILENLSEKYKTTDGSVGARCMALAGVCVEGGVEPGTREGRMQWHNQAVGENVFNAEKICLTGNSYIL